MSMEPNRKPEGLERPPPPPPPPPPKRAEVVVRVEIVSKP